MVKEMTMLFSAKNFRLVTLTMALCFLAMAKNTEALIPVVDPGTIGQCVINNAKLLHEQKFVVEIMNRVDEMNKTIGEAKSNFFNFLNDGDFYGDGNTPNGEYDQDYDHLPDNKVPGPEDAEMNIIEDLGASLDPRKAEIQIADNNNILYSSATVSSQMSVASADVVMGENASYGDGKYNGKYDDKFIFPDQLAQVCEINVSDIDSIDKKVKMIECMKKLLRLRIADDQATQTFARNVYYSSMMETAYANIAEALVTRNFGVHYEKEILKPLSKKAIKAKTERDDYAVTMVMNKEIARILNRMYNVYAMRVSYDMLQDYGNFVVYPEQLKDEHEDPNPRGTQDKVFFLPKTLSEYCGINVSDITEQEDKKVIVNCLEKLIDFRAQDNQATKQEAKAIYDKSREEQNYASYAEALLARLYSLDYEKDVLGPIESQGISSLTAKVDYDTVVKSNKEFANILTKIMSVYAMKVANDSFKDYGDYEIIREQILQTE